MDEIAGSVKNEMGTGEALSAGMADNLQSVAGRTHDVIAYSSGLLGHRSGDRICHTARFSANGRLSTAGARSSARLHGICDPLANLGRFGDLVFGDCTLESSERFDARARCSTGYQTPRLHVQTPLKPTPVHPGGQSTRPGESFHGGVEPVFCSADDTSASFSDTPMSLADLRRQYTLAGLHESDLPSDPITAFGDWLQTALDNVPAEWIEPYAMTLATSKLDGNVSARIVLLRGFDQQGFVFYTNYESRKGRELEDNPHAALVFHWDYLERQVRIEGTVSRVERELSENYFHRRPRGSQLGAAVSKQSAELGSREELESAVQKFESTLPDGAPVPLPEFWGGYRVAPTTIEFWQGRENRLHDRLIYRRRESDWERQRLSP